MSETSVWVEARRWAPCGSCHRHVRVTETLCPFCANEPHAIELRPVRSQPSFKVALAAALAGASAVSPAEASSDLQPRASSQGYSRWGIAQGATRYGGAPVSGGLGGIGAPSAQPRTPQLSVRLLDAPTTSGPVALAILRQLFMARSPGVAVCGDSRTRSIGDPTAISRTTVTAQLEVDARGNVGRRARVQVEPGDPRVHTVRPELTECLRSRLATMRFPLSGNGAPASGYTVTYRFEFGRASR
jgi:hypothetical protein